MMIDLTCQKCDGSFEVDATELIEGNEPIRCPNCDAKAPQALVDDFGNALGELVKQTAALSKRFQVSLALESDDLPPPYDVEPEEEEDEDEDEEDEEEELFDDAEEEYEEEEDY